MNHALLRWLRRPLSEIGVVKSSSWDERVSVLVESVLRDTTINHGYTTHVAGGTEEHTPTSGHDWNADDKSVWSRDTQSLRYVCGIAKQKRKRENLAVGSRWPVMVNAR